MGKKPPQPKVFAEPAGEIERRTKRGTTGTLATKNPLRALEESWRKGWRETVLSHRHRPVEGFSAKDNLVAAAWIKRLAGDPDGLRHLCELVEFAAHAWPTVTRMKGFWPPQPVGAVPSFKVLHLAKDFFEAEWYERHRPLTPAELEAERVLDEEEAGRDGRRP